MTEEEAKKIASKKNASSLGFCPVINNPCRSDCVFCAHSSVHLKYRSLDEYVVTEKYCDYMNRRD